MSFKPTAALLLLALTAAGCADQAPTTPDLSSTNNEARFSNPNDPEHAVKRAASLTEIPIEAVDEAGDTVEAALSITHFDAVQTGGTIQLLADGVVSYVDEDGQYLAEAFEDLPITLSRTAPASGGGSAALIASGVSLQRGPAESGVCDILYLTLGPLFLDVLGLTVDLSVIELDLDAVAGAGNLLGNLLCAVTGLLDGLGTLIQILQILEQINDILDGINNLLSSIPILGSVIAGDATTPLALAIGGAAGRVEDSEFSGTLTITDISWDEAGTLLVDGILNGKARVDGKMTQIRGVEIEDVPATLSATSGAVMGAALRAPNEANVCDVLYLDLAPTFLDLLGLTVDLAEVELDVDAVPGSGNLLGNLLCAVTGLLDGAGGGGLGGLQGLLQGLLDAIGQLLGGLSL